MNRIKLFSKLLRIRTLFKRVNQLSWTIQKFENKFSNLDEFTPEEHQDLLEAYFGFIEEFMTIYEVLKNERNSK